MNQSQFFRTEVNRLLDFLDQNPQTDLDTVRTEFSALNEKSAPLLEKVYRDRRKNFPQSDFDYFLRQLDQLTDTNQHEMSVKFSTEMRQRYFPQDILQKEGLTE